MDGLDFARAKSRLSGGVLERHALTDQRGAEQARPIPAEPAPWKRYFSSLSFVPLSFVALITPASVIPELCPIIRPQRRAFTIRRR
jgi:hypothetical protein